MRKLILGIALAAVTAATFVAAPQVQAQANYPNVSGLTPFSPDCNFMSKPGYLRYRHFVNTGEWLTYERAAAIVAEQGG